MLASVVNLSIAEVTIQKCHIAASKVFSLCQVGNFFWAKLYDHLWYQVGHSLSFPQTVQFSGLLNQIEPGQGHPFEDDAKGHQPQRPRQNTRPRLLLDRKPLGRLFIIILIVNSYIYILYCFSCFLSMITTMILLYHLRQRWRHSTTRSKTFTGRRRRAIAGHQHHSHGQTKSSSLGALSLVRAPTTISASMDKVAIRPEISD